MDTPIELDKENKYEILDEEGLLHITLPNGTILKLKPKSKEDTEAYHAAHGLKLNTMRRKHAKSALKLAKTIRKATKELMAIEKRMCQESISIAGEFYENFHTVSFQEHGSNESQMDCDGFITTPDFASMLRTADGLVCTLEPTTKAE